MPGIFVLLNFGPYIKILNKKFSFYFSLNFYIKELFDHAMDTDGIKEIGMARENSNFIDGGGVIIVGNSLMISRKSVLAREKGVN